MYLQVNKHEIYKQLCINSYHPEQSLPTGCKFLFSKTGESGFYARVIQNGNNIIIVCRGTSNFDGLKDDYRMWIKEKLPNQEKEALAFCDIVNKYCKENGYSITVIGHSLGGSLAQIISAKRNIEAVTFNAYGTRNLLNPNIKYFTNKVINYCCDSDVITRINAENHIGKCYSISSSDYTKDPHKIEYMDSLNLRQKVSGEFLEYQYHKDLRESEELEYYIRTGKRKPIQMPAMGYHSEDCAGTYMVSGYTREDGTRVASYPRTCGAKHLS